MHYSSVVERKFGLSTQPQGGGNAGWNFGLYSCPIEIQTSSVVATALNCRKGSAYHSILAGTFRDEQYNFWYLSYETSTEPSGQAIADVDIRTSNSGSVDCLYGYTKACQFDVDGDGAVGSNGRGHWMTAICYEMETFNKNQDFVQRIETRATNSGGVPASPVGCLRAGYWDVNDFGMDSDGNQGGWNYGVFACKGAQGPACGRRTDTLSADICSNYPVLGYCNTNNMRRDCKLTCCLNALYFSQG